MGPHGRPTRREFLGALGALAGGLPARAGGTQSSPASAAARLSSPFPDARRLWHGASSAGFDGLAAAWRVQESGDRRRPPAERDVPRLPREWQRHPAARLDGFRDLRRHLVFEYYPWYATDPWYHWNEGGRLPPDDIAASSYPLLGPYDSRDRRVIERHARWIAEAGVGAVNISWWGRGSPTDLAVHDVMDVMRAHDVHVAFHVEPYREDRGAHLADDLLYLVREYGDRRGWDAFLLLEDASGRSGPVFKLFAAILPRQVTDCLGRTFRVAHFVEDAAWRRQTDLVRRELARDFDRVLVLADSLDAARTQSAGFDGVAVYDNFVRPETWRDHAAAMSARGLLFSFNVNAGFDAAPPREVPADPCWRPAAFEPGGRALDWPEDAARDEAMRLGTARIRESFERTLALQTSAALIDARRGFLLVYVNSWNEWHEGTQFEPMKAARDLTPAERRRGYHNAPVGDYRLRVLGSLVGGLTAGAANGRQAVSVPRQVAAPLQEEALS